MDEAILSGLARRSEPMLKAYKEAEVAYRSFEETGSATALLKVAKILCSELGQLEGDEVFWASLNDALPEIRGQRSPLDDIGQRIESFHAFELRVLIEIGHLEPVVAERLISSVQLAVQSLGRNADSLSFENLKGTVAALRGEICREDGLVKRAPNEQVMNPVRRRTFTASLFVVGAAGLASLNAFAAMHGGDATQVGESMFGSLIAVGGARSLYP
jgi:hypothetical protein